MKQMIAALLLILISTSALADKWYDSSTFPELSTVEVKPTGWSSHWAGRITGLYFDEKADEMTKVKIKVTWITDEANVSCGQIIIRHREDIQDFTSRSVMLKKCR